MGKKSLQVTELRGCGLSPCKAGEEAPEIAIRPILARKNLFFAGLIAP
jgi:hypothetical protein